ncbi:ATP binding domain 4 [Rhizophlyctis rosea]|uniref:Diphthine--ammonia ligase n=1 Tax=Rhizophlyctis rosea TaxID=64517 RepID=A0AAD5SGS8_9FUNG|nr:ATP binding domain 4 [Rhizophlyctis rosea]
MGLPMFRRAINGTSAVQTSDYTPTEGDEVEDLYLLLLDVKSQIPDIEAVATGAILSNYQRVRVENICARLGLKSLAYLWRRDQTELMREMVDSGLEAILIKVAALGLKEAHLGKTLGQMYPHLLSMHDRYGAHVCGEGGEFETLTLDCPLFVKRLVIDETKRVIHSDDAFAVVAYLNITKAHVEVKNAEDVCRDPERLRQLLPLPEIEDLDLGSLPEDIFTNPQLSLPAVAETRPKPWSSRCRFIDPFFAMSGATINDVTPEPKSISLEEEVRLVMEFVQSSLFAYGLDWTNVTLMHVYVADMADFALVNQAYGKFFGMNPPPRVTVEIPVSSPMHIQIDCMAFKPPDKRWDRETMHVQSVSYWAPANIGPYSQATLIADQAYTAGMIGLIPHSMELPTSTDPMTSLKEETRQSLKSLSEVVKAIGLDLETDAAGCVCYVSKDEWVGVARKGWEEVLEGRIVPISFVTVPRLPRNAIVEWQVVYQNSGSQWSNRGRNDDDDDTDDEEDGADVGELSWEVHKGAGTVECTSRGWSRGDFAVLNGDVKATGSDEIGQLTVDKAVELLWSTLKESLSRATDLGKHVLWEHSVCVRVFVPKAMHSAAVDGMV